MELPTRPSESRVIGSQYVPQQMTPEELFLRLTETPCPTEVVPYPRDESEGGPKQIRIRVLRDEETARKRIVARRWAQKEYGMSDGELDSEEGRQIVAERLAKEILSMAILCPDPIEDSEKVNGQPIYPRLFTSPDRVGKIPSREIGILWGLWNLVQNRIGPNDGAFESDAEVEDWVKTLEEGARPFGFFLLELPVQEALITKLLSQASLLYRLLNCPSETLQTTLESILESWDFGTSSSTEPAADSTNRGSQNSQQQSLAEVELSTAEALEQAKLLRKAGRLNEDLKAK